MSCSGAGFRLQFKAVKRLDPEDRQAVTTLLDSVLHHAEIVLLKGKSYRMFDRQQRRRSPNDLTDTTS